MSQSIGILPMTLLPIDTILTGDCLEILGKLPRDSVDHIFADPPYNLQLSRELQRPNHSRVSAVTDAWDYFPSFIEYDKFTHNWLEACKRVLKETGTLWVIGTYHNIYRVGSILQDLGFWILNDIVWVKTNPMPNFRGVRFTNAHEILIWAQKNKGAKYVFNHRAMKSLNGDLQMRSDWVLPICTGKERLRKNGKKLHSTQKPEALLYRVFLSSTKPGDIVLDPFFGSGTTGVVARKLGRHYIGIENNEEYVKFAINRIAGTKPIPNSALQFQEPRNRVRISFGSLIETGMLNPGQTLYLANNEAVTATILANGQIRCGELTGSIHSLAKSLLQGEPSNGWDCWLCDIDDKKVMISNLREILQIAKEETGETKKKNSEG